MLKLLLSNIKKVCLSILFIFLVSCVYGQQLNIINPDPTPETVYGIDFTDKQHGWMVDINGNVFKTLDGGKNWIHLNSLKLYTNFVWGSKFINENTGFIYGSDGILFTSFNGGADWQKSNVDFHGSFKNTSFYNKTGILVGDSGTIYKSDDEGKSWQKIDQSFTTKDLTDVKVFEDSTVIICGDSGVILKSEDFGENWINNNLNTNSALKEIYKDSSRLYICSISGKIWKSTNKGESWGEIFSGSKLNGVDDIFFENDTAYAFTNFNTFKSVDQGNTWNQVPNTLNNINTSYFFSPDSFFVSMVNSVYSTTNGGQNFQNIKKGFTISDINDITFINEKTGILCTERGNVFKKNENHSWFKTRIDNQGKLKEIQFLDDKKGYVGGNKGLYTTNDGGFNWDKVTGKELHDLFFVNKDTGWVLNQFDDKIFKTTDGGDTWMEQSPITGDNFKGLFFNSYGKGWIITNDGMLFKTLDGGNTWDSTFISPKGNSVIMKDIYFYDDQSGWIITNYHDGIFYTHDGGDNWNLSNRDNIMDFASGIHFITPDTGYFINSSGALLKTNDGGMNWDTVFINNTTSSQNDIYAFDTSNIWIVGQVGLVKHYGKNKKEYFNEINGKVFQNNNNAKCVQKKEMANILIKAVPGPVYTQTDSLGRYTLKVDTGSQTYKISQIIPERKHSIISQECPENSDHEVSFSNAFQDTNQINFVNHIKQCSKINVDVASDRRRRCFQNTTTVKICNEGKAKARNFKVDVIYPEYVRPADTDPAWDHQKDSLFVFEFDSLSAGQCRNIFINDTVKCGNAEILGLNQCVKAEIFPKNTCDTLHPKWDSSHVEVDATCRPDDIAYLKLKNTGSGDMEDSSEFRVYFDAFNVYRKSFKLNSGDSLIFNTPIDSQTVRIEADQHQHHPDKRFSSETLQACGSDSLDEVSNGFAGMFPRDDFEEERAVSCLPIVGSFDPNDKLASPLGVTENNYIDSTTRIKYKIRFQNTGNDTAYKVVIKDTLSPHLDIATFRAGASSHDYKVDISGKGRPVLTFTFNDIDLVDSVTNEPESHGYVSFSIGQDSSNETGTTIKNKASIFFDFNKPVITNEVSFKVWDLPLTDLSKGDEISEGIVTSVNKVHEVNDLRVYPNPASDRITVSLPEKYIGIHEILVRNVHGKMVKNIQYSAKQRITLSTQSLASGMYFLFIKNKKGITGHAKFMINH